MKVRALKTYQSLKGRQEDEDPAKKTKKHKQVKSTQGYKGKYLCGYSMSYFYTQKYFAF